jgi:hypothetical protein
MTNKIPIAAQSPAQYDDTAHLQPVLDYLARKGNVPVNDPPFRGDPAGLAICTMQRQIDWDDLQAHFEFPTNFWLSKQYGLLRDQSAGVEIDAGDQP